MKWTVSLSEPIETECAADQADIQEYLLLKGVEAVAIHGSKSELDRA